MSWALSAQLERAHLRCDLLISPGSTEAKTSHLLLVPEVSLHNDTCTVLCFTDLTIPQAL